MTLHRQNPRRDANEAAIVDALEAIGVVVCRISGAGLPDLLCYRRGFWVPLEVKHGRRAVTVAQAELRAIAPYPVVRTIPEALAVFGVTG